MVFNVSADIKEVMFEIVIWFNRLILLQCVITTILLLSCNEENYVSNTSNAAALNR